MYDNNRGWGRGSSFGGFGGGGRGRGGSGRRDERPEMFRAVCGDCGRNCEVPFKPTGDRPVFCSDCFKNQDGGGREERGGRGRFEERGRRDDFGEKRMYGAVCDQCGEACEVPFKPSSDKPVFCSNCFVKEDRPKSKGGADYKAEFTALNEKLDLIIKSLGISEVKKEKAKTKAVKDVENEDSLEIADKEIDDMFDQPATPKKEKAPKKAKKATK